jgi:glucose/arabinose dehydrogenase
MINKIFSILIFFGIFYIPTLLAGMQGESEFSYKYIHSTYLPLDINLKKIDFYPLSICKIDSDILMLDKKGDLFLIKDNFFTERLNHPLIINISKTDLIKEGNSYSVPFHSVTYDPKRKEIYVSYERYISHNVNHFSIASIKYDSINHKTIGNWKIVYESKDINHQGKKISGVTAAGGKLYFKDETLFFSVGSYSTNNHIDESIDPQFHNAVKGKIYSLDLINQNIDIYSLGHRNPQGMVFTSDNVFYATEHGPEGGDELNIIIKGGNYGWPIRTFGTDYGYYSWIPPPNNHISDQSTPKFIEPVFSWLPDIGISFVNEIRSFNEKWDGDLLIGGMRAQSIFRLKILNGHVAYVEQIKIGKRVRDLVGVNRKLFFITDEGFIGTITVNKAKIFKDIIKKKWNN